MFRTAVSEETYLDGDRVEYVDLLISLVRLTEHHRDDQRLDQTRCKDHQLRPEYQQRMARAVMLCPAGEARPGCGRRWLLP